MHKWARFIKNIVGQWNYFEPPANTKRKKKSYDDHLEKSCVYKILSLILILFENHFYKQINKLTCFVLHIILLVIKISIPFGDQWLVIQVKRRKLKRTIQTFLLHFHMVSLERMVLAISYLFMFLLMVFVLSLTVFP